MSHLVHYWNPKAQPHQSAERLPSPKTKREMITLSDITSKQFADMAGLHAGMELVSGSLAVTAPAQAAAAEEALRLFIMRDADPDKSAFPLSKEKLQG